MQAVGHRCPKCERIWASNSCWKNPAGCNRVVSTCPPCSSMGGLSFPSDDWRYGDDFKDWVRKTRKEAGIV